MEINMKNNIITNVLIVLFLIQSPTETQFELKKFTPNNKIHLMYGGIILVLLGGCYYTNNNKNKTIDFLQEKNKNLQKNLDPISKLQQENTELKNKKDQLIKEQIALDEKLRVFNIEQTNEGKFVITAVEKDIERIFSECLKKNTQTTNINTNVNKSVNLGIFIKNTLLRGQYYYNTK